MSIYLERQDKPTHEENMIYFAECLGCPKISEENGDYLPGNFEVASFGDNLNMDQVKILAKNHENNITDPHKIIIRGFDVGKLHEPLGH